ncbi:MAG: bifunctional folylpolyglutamate synthase/dihydrofolate synthase, partial [Acidobacteria bacterium]|nr:bifunctional folylpolyglutamate synthase/dihydrofolate synthase [Acidobacteriota bacterium]
PDLRPALVGLHQRENVDVAVAVIDAMRGTGMELSDDAARAGVELVEWPGRLERLVAGNTDVLIDAAHNRAGAKALAAHLRDIRWADAALVFGAMTDKDATGMLQELSETVAAIVCTTAASPRAETAERLALIAAGIQGHPPVHAVQDPLEAFAAARALSGRVVIAGSIFLIGPLRGILR